MLANLPSLKCIKHFFVSSFLSTTQIWPSYCFSDVGPELQPSAPGVLRRELQLPAGLQKRGAHIRLSPRQGVQCLSGLYCAERSRHFQDNIHTRYLSAYGKLTVVKKCGSSEDCEESEQYWWRDECDRKSDDDSYTCTTCCSHNMCNSAAGSNLISLYSFVCSVYHISAVLNKSYTSWSSLSLLNLTSTLQ